MRSAISLSGGSRVLPGGAVLGAAALLMAGCGASHDASPASEGGTSGGPGVGRDSGQLPPVGGLQIYGAWHCSNDACTWSTLRDSADFDRNNHWIIDRGDGVPSFNLVILSFVNPVKLLDRTTDAQTTRGVPIAINTEIVDYFAKSGNARLWNYRQR